VLILLLLMEVVVAALNAVFVNHWLGQILDGVVERLFSRYPLAFVATRFLVVIAAIHAGLAVGTIGMRAAHLDTLKPMETSVSCQD
jgi:hypothetical protein